MKIKKITKIGKHSQRYDIEVKDNHNFFANGILVHNSNFSFWSNGEEVMCAKRSGIIGNSDFYNYERVLYLYEKAIFELYEEVTAKINQGRQKKVSMGVVGELHGGSYPHPDIPAENVKTIQKGVWYSPNIEFRAFDIWVEDVGFINVDTMNELLMKYGVPHCEILMEGTFDEVIGYNNEFQTTIPGLLGLPEITDNICEGVVIRPNNDKYLHVGERVILKSKNLKHSEKNKEPKKQVSVEHLTTEQEVVYESIIEYVTENRLKNVISKVGQITDKQFGMLMGLMMKDVIEDFNKDNEGLLHLSKQHAKMVKKLLGGCISILIQKHFINILDNNF